jgi:ornithine carbamoyltransferase
MRLHIGTAAETKPDDFFLKQARAAGLSEIVLTEDPKEAAAKADVIYTDVWASMGQKDKAEEKARVLNKYQVNSALVNMAAPDCLVMHCLPAERGREITDDVIDGPHSVVFDEAENRMHIQKAIMVFAMA